MFFARLYQIFTQENEAVPGGTTWRCAWNINLITTQVQNTKKYQKKLFNQNKYEVTGDYIYCQITIYKSYNLQNYKLQITIYKSQVKLQITVKQNIVKKTK